MDIKVREAVRKDAEGIIGYMRELSSDPELYIGFGPGEFDATVEEEIVSVEKYARAENSIILLAVATDGEREKWDLDDGELVGLMECTGGVRPVFRHVTTLGISIKADWRGQGIGSRLMDEGIEWAKATGVVKRVQLEVVTENVEARKLYERRGFVSEGVRRRAMWKRGRWMDSEMMALLF